MNGKARGRLNRLPTRNKTRHGQPFQGFACYKDPFSQSFKPEAKLQPDNLTEVLKNHFGLRTTQGRRSSFFPRKRCSNNRESRHSEPQVQALFLDYDGTISPLNVPRSESRVLPGNRAVLHQISQKVPVAIMTTKDLSFIVKRTPFAHAWFSLASLEMKIGNSVTRAPCLRKMKLCLTSALEHAKTHSGNVLEIEEKRDSEGNTVAFSVDWRQTKDRFRAEEKAMRMISFLETFPVFVTKYEGQPFFDVFSCSIDKGKALLKLKRKLHLRKGILYIGDSNVDNPAFKVADIAVGVLHAETPESLVCDYFVIFEDVPAFLRGLLKNDFRFNPKLPLVMDRTEALRLIRQRKPVK